MIGRQNRHAHQFDGRTEETFGLAQRQLEYVTQHETHSDCCLGETRLPERTERLPVVPDAFLKPQGQTAAAARARFALRPVQKLERHLRNGISALGIMFVGDGKKWGQKI